MLINDIVGTFMGAFNEYEIRQAKLQELSSGHNMLVLVSEIHLEQERGFEPGSAGYKATALPFELSSIDLYLKMYWETY